MAEFENVFIYVSDSLRYDYIPESIAEEGNVIPTLIPAGYSPISFASLATGLDARNHNVRSFYDTVKEETAFDRFENHCFYDHPDDALVRNVFQNYESSVELDEIETPFFYIERAMDTHTPYGEMSHGNAVPDEPDNSGDIEKRYRDGVKSTEEHFWRHVEELKDRGIYEDTLIIFTADHGEFLGERYLGTSRQGHNRPIREELCVVPTVFLNYDNEWKRARTVDLTPTALQLTGREPLGDGNSLLGNNPDHGHVMLQVNTHPLIVTGSKWSWRDKWRLSEGRIRVDTATKFIDWLNPLRERLRSTPIGELCGSDTTEQRKFEPDEELKDIDF